MRAAWSAIVLFLAVLTAGCGSDEPAAAVEEATPAPFNGTLIEPAAEMPRFELIGTDGQPLGSDDLRGRFVAVYFGYTHCPDICPLTLGVLKGAVELLTPEEQAQFAVLMIAVDPERDTPEVLGRYMDLFHPEFEAATGEPERVQAVLDSWGVHVTRQPIEGGGYTVSHPASVYLLDPEGRWVLAFDHTHSPDAIAADLHRLIAGASTAAGPPTATSADRTPASSSAAGGRAERWFFALGDGSVIMREADGIERQVLRPWSEQPSDDELARRQYPGAREIAYDAETATLWFADTHEAIHSVNVDTGERGLSIDGFADAALPGCGVADLSREFALLPGGRLIVPTLLGTTVIYSTEDGSMVGALSPGAFGSPLLAQFRPFIAAGSHAWFADAAGVLHAFDPQQWTLLEASVALPDAPGSALVEIALSPDGMTIYYLAESGELRAWDAVSGATTELPPAVPADTRAIAVG